MSRILVTDDSLLQRQMLSACLREEGHEPVTANNGREALEQIHAQLPDCLILDLLMPEVDGIQVLEALQNQNVKFPIIVLTADIQEWMKTKCLELGVRKFLKKPVKEDLLRAVLREVLGTTSNHTEPCQA